MHREALQWVAKIITLNGYDVPGVSVLDLGGRDVNGTTRDLWGKPGRYVVVDNTPGPGVDFIEDAADFDLADYQPYDVVTSTECLEHAERAGEIVKTAFRCLRDGGAFIATMAGPGRPPHGQHGAPTPAEGEFYRNVEPEQLNRWIHAAGFGWWEIDTLGTDLRCHAVKGRGHVA